MKVKLIIADIFLLSACMTIMSCSEDEIVFDNSNSHTKEVSIDLPSPGVIIPRDGGVVTLPVKSSYYWKIYGKSDWCTLSTTEGAPGESVEIKISAPANDSELPRWVRLTLSSGYDAKAISVMQLGDGYETPDRTGMESTASELFFSIYNGWNLGNTMESRDDRYFGTGVSTETAWGNPVVTKEFIDYVYSYGFNGIRIPCGWQYHIINDTDPDGADYMKIHPDWMARVKEVVDYCLSDKPDMKVFLNMHHCPWIDERWALTGREAPASELKMLLVWRQIAQAFKDYDERLIFGGCNEPEARDPERAKILERYEQAFVNAIRSTGGKNTYRKLVIQAPATNTGHALSFMPDVVDYIPLSCGIEVHMYEPQRYCSSDGDGWNAAYFWGHDYLQKPIMGIDRNSPENEEEYDETCLRLKKKFVDNGIPIMAGEYGLFHKEFDYSPAVQRAHDRSYNYYYYYTTISMKRHGLVPFVWDACEIFDRRGMGVFNTLAMDGTVRGAAEADYPEPTHFTEQQKALL